MYPSIKEKMYLKVNMEGSVNCHAFKCTAVGEGKPYEGKQQMKITVDNGPLPFAFDVLAHAFGYGIKVFTKYPDDIPDFFKQALPGGFSWERTTKYEDGGVLLVTQDTSLKDNCIICNVKVLGTGFPANGPVMQKKTVGWEPSTEMAIPRDGGLLMRDTTALVLADNAGHLGCTMETTYKSKKEVKLPELHFHHLRLETLNESDKGDTIELHETVIASYSDVPSNLGRE